MCASEADGPFLNEIRRPTLDQAGRLSGKRLVVMDDPAWCGSSVHKLSFLRRNLTFVANFSGSLKSY